MTITDLAIALRRAEQDIDLTHRQHLLAVSRRDEAQKALDDAVDAEIRARQAGLDDA